MGLIRDIKTLARGLDRQSFSRGMECGLAAAMGLLELGVLRLGANGEAELRNTEDVEDFDLTRWLDSFAREIDAVDSFASDGTGGAS